MLPVEGDDVAHEAHAGASGAAGELVGQLFLAALGIDELHLDQLVIVEGLLDLLEHGIGDAVLPDVDHRLDVVGQATQVLSLGAAELFHGGDAITAPAAQAAAATTTAVP